MVMYLLSVWGEVSPDAEADPVMMEQVATPRVLGEDAGVAWTGQ